MKPFWKAIFISICITVFTAATVYAQVSMKGWFIAGQTCEAYQSIKKGTNPGHVRLVPKKKYELIAKNKRDYFSANIGKTISVANIRDKFDQAFGHGAGKKINVKCSSGMITELWINLKGEITPQSDVALLLKNADKATSKCRSGVIDPVGY
nr:hypothetical protein [uncultured Desulfobacter sp.]